MIIKITILSLLWFFIGYVIGISKQGTSVIMIGFKNITKAKEVSNDMENN